MLDPDSGYQYSHVHRVIHDGNPHIETSIYRFRTDCHRTYLINVERHVNDIYVIKFYDKNHRDSDDKYNLVFNDHDALKVIATVIT